MSAKNRAGDSSDRAHGQFQNRGRDLDAEFRGNGRIRPLNYPHWKAAPFLRRKTKIDPEVQKRDNECRAKQLPPHGEECPEDAA